MTDDQPKATSPSASGPAGSLFEGRVAAHYLLTMLAEADPRGFPGMIVQCVEMQRRGEKHPLDDVIVRGITKIGESAVIEVQVKRKVTFAPADAEFKDIVLQLAQAFQNLDLSNERHQFAVAIKRTSFKIDGSYQDVLNWAREVGDASTFIERIERRNVGNEDMRNFVATFRSHLKEARCAHDDETVWQILRRFQILPFDYDAPGSQSLELALERARNVLDSKEAPRANDFWRVLTETAIRIASSGGDRDRERLLKDIDGFPMRGSKRNRGPRETLSETANLAAADLQCKVAGITLARTALLKEVRNARDIGRYIEIRGEPGVGKSGLLGMLVKETLTEARAIVLTPQRTTPRGASAFKSEFGVDGDLRDFLADLASDGGAVLFVDNLDFFDDRDKRVTISDLVRSAAEVPGFQVIVTARTYFGTKEGEPNWLPQEALERLGRAPPVVVEKLNDEEINELGEGVPALHTLLADEHPARKITRNLFRLSRLLEAQDSVEGLRSEGDMLKRWWATADGATEEGRRERKRLLTDLSDAAITGNDHLRIRASPTAIKALIESGTLREIDDDQFAFRHDILRDWGVAARLYNDPELLDKLPLARPAPASLARGVELAARLALEGSEDGQHWIKHLDRVSKDDAHPSWRRFSLLAILRSELAFTLLNRAAESLFAQDGVLLRELIRTAIAVESRQLAEMFQDRKLDASAIPTSIYAPANPSWVRLAHWLVERQADLPLQALPEVIDLFQKLSILMVSGDPFAPEVANPLMHKMATVLVDWLDEIEDARNRSPLTEDRGRFATAYRHRNLYGLANDVRQAFALMAACVPKRARDYLLRLMKRRNSGDAISHVIRIGGTFARAAPAELVELTLTGLTAMPLRAVSRSRTMLGLTLPAPITTHDEEKSQGWLYSRENVLTHLDNKFLPSSPARGPFLDLLNAAPTHGLSLIRRLVDHAVTVQSTGRKPGKDGLTLTLPSGPRFFPWLETHYWSRDARGHYSIESALMALEAWSHARVERGDPPEWVIDDILGPEGSPAAFLLVATDILISHWPKTLNTITPFLGSPELLSLERMRQAHDSMRKMSPLSQISNEPKEPSGPFSLADLKKRPSRHIPLETLLGSFAHAEGADLKGLRRILKAATKRLGLPDPDDSFAEPRFMARYALNLTDTNNWQLKDGKPTYISPPDEAHHITKIQAKHERETADRSIDIRIQGALNDVTQSSPELAELAIAYAKRLETVDSPQDILKSRTNAIVSAAMIVARDGTDELLAKNEKWIRGAFTSAFAATDHDISRNMRDDILFNPVAIATLGVIHLWRRLQSDADRDMLLALAGREDANSAQGFGTGIDVLLEHDRRLIPAALRCAFSAQIHPKYRWNNAEEERAPNLKRYRKRVKAAIHAECAWLRGKTEEPDWPTFPAPTLYIKRGLHIDMNDVSEQSSTTTDTNGDELNAQHAALWLRQLMRNADKRASDWLLGLVSAYADWTASANGSGHEPHAEINNHLGNWNSIFFHLLARAVPSAGAEWALAEVAQAIDVPDKSFFEIATDLVFPLDQLYFNDRGLDIGTALALRDLVVERLINSTGWKREQNNTEMSAERRIGPAIGTLFFNDYNSFGPAQCFLPSEYIDQIDPFLPQLTRLINEGPVPLISFFTMNLLEVSPQSAHAKFFLSSALTWLRRQFSNAQLWVDLGLGARLARWIESVTKSDESLRDAEHILRPQIDEVLGKLVQIGVSEAHRVERALASA